MSLNHQDYFSQDRAVNFGVVLRHFKDQASGKSDAMFIHSVPRTSSEKRASQAKDSLVLIDVGDDTPSDDKKRGQMPKIQVIDPLKAETNRAIHQLEQEEKEGGDAHSREERGNAPQFRNPTYGGSINKKPHSVSGAGRKKKRGGTTSAGRATVKAKIKRTKDIFD